MDKPQEASPLSPWPGMASANDLAQIYRCLLGREAEAGLLAAPGRRPLLEVVTEMACSDEMNQLVLHPLVQERPLPHDHLSQALRQEASDWLLARLGLPARSNAGEPPDAAQLLAQALALDGLDDALLMAHGSLATQALADLDSQVNASVLRLTGKIEFANREYISGWAAEASGRLMPLQLEIRQRGRVVAFASAYGFRPDVQRRFGGQGLAGFRAPWDPSGFAAGQSLVFTLHEASTGRAFGSPYRFDNSFIEQLGVAQQLAKEFDEIKRRLDVLAGMVPQALSFSAFPLAHYDLYRRTHRIPEPPVLASDAPGSGGDERFTVLLDAGRGSASDLRATVDALRAQRFGHWRVLVTGAEASVAETARLLGHADPRVLCPEGMAPVAAELEQLAGDVDQWMLLLEAGEVLDPLSLDWLVHAKRHSAGLGLYWDEDQLQHAGGRLPGPEPRHVQPVLRQPFDPDSMLELNVCGTSLAIRADVLEAACRLLDPLAPARALALDERERLVWALHRCGPLQHVPQPLSTRLLPPGSEPVDRLRQLFARATPEQLGGLLPEAWLPGSWARQPDPLNPEGKPVVAWKPLRPGLVISVLIPTRDHGELVRECVGSLRRMAQWPGLLDIVVADNGSTDPETLAMLAQAEAAGELRTLRIDEPFNWSRLNNQMAAAARGEMLLFLNDDTRMLTRHWDTALRGLLERADVAAVGARLLYEDMTIQHAGVLVGHEGFVAHDGVGRPVDDPLGGSSHQLSRRMPAVTGAFLACRADLFWRTGGFDEARLSVTFNDVDWCLRLRRLEPRRCIVCAPLLSLIHLESKSRGFDFQDPAKQARAEYERTAFESMAGPDYAAQDTQHPILSRWVRPGSALR